MTFETSSSISQFNYHVFLSFRGNDTRNNFTDHLYTALSSAGIHTFRDDDAIGRGENIHKEIEKAIQKSQISLIVFSKGFASSKWCMDELVMIMECTTTTGLIALPIFFDVDPSDVSEQSGSFNEAFSSHEECFKKEKVDSWKDALRKASNLAGMVLGERSEAQFIQEIVKNVGNKLHITPLFVSSNLVGAEARIRPINTWLQDELNDDGIGIIYGIGGIGKTTIAKIVYNCNCDMFEVSCFLANVRETANQPNGLLLLQIRLLKRIVKRSVQIDSVDEGVIQIKQAIYGRRFLLVLDDVDSSDQFNAIVGMEEWCFHGSKIIITTRNKRVLHTKLACKKFEIDVLEDDESLKLFSWHAFGQAYPIEEYWDQSKIAISHCCGLPLALEVLGSCLSSLDRGLWERALQEPEQIDDECKIQKILKISYDSLQDNRDKNLFLDIACFFINKGKNYVVNIVKANDSYRILGIQSLVDRCLVKIVSKNKLIMHQLLIDMGKEIVRQESENPSKRSRIWRHKDAVSILRKNIGTETIKSFILNQKQVKTSSRNVDFRTSAFERMNNLKLLHLDDVEVNGRFEEFPKDLVWLNWRHFPWKCFPNTFPMDDLIVLDMKYSKITHVWKGTLFLEELRVLNLSHCHSLMRSPNFFGLPNLEMLILKRCVNLVEVHESIGFLERLVLLNLKDCANLEHLSENLSMLKSLETLVLSGCSKLKIPKAMYTKLESLKFLKMDGIAANQVQSATKMWPLMSWLSPRKRPSSITFSLDFLPRSLVELSLRRCNLLDENLPGDFSCLPLLESLDLSENPFQFLPESIENLTVLKNLNLEGCENLQSLPELPRSLERFDAKWRTVLMKKNSDKESRSNDPFEIWRKLELITDDDMNMMREVGLFNLESKEGIQVEMFDLVTETTRGQAPLQILHECCIFSIFLFGSDIPHWFNYQSEGPAFYFVASSPPGHKICGFNLCILYEPKASIILEYKELKSSRFKKYWKPLRTCIVNRTKMVDWYYAPTFVGITESHQDMLWLSHWKFADQLTGNGDPMFMESGDKVEVEVGRVFTSNTYVKKCGIHLVYLSEKEESSPNYYQNMKFADQLAENGDMMYMESGDEVEVKVETIAASNNYVKKCGIHEVSISQNEESSPNYHQNMKCGYACCHTPQTLINLRRKEKTENFRVLFDIHNHL